MSKTRSGEHRDRKSVGLKALEYRPGERAALRESAKQAMVGRDWARPSQVAARLPDRPGIRLELAVCAAHIVRPGARIKRLNLFERVDVGEAAILADLLSEDDEVECRGPVGAREYRLAACLRMVQ